MAAFSIHPHTGFLNTNFTVRTDIVFPILNIKRVADEFGNEIKDQQANIVNCKSELPSFSLSIPGIYNIALQGYPSEYETITVKDAIRLGGSTYKNSYIYDETPWCFVVMKDRTYLYNRDTEEELIESISPQYIRPISRDVVMFEDSRYNDFTLFSLSLMRPIANVSNIGFLSTGLLISRYDDSVIMAYKFSDRIESRFDIQCSEYSIDESNTTLYTYNGKTIDVYGLESLKKITEYNIEGQFIGFIQQRYAVQTVINNSENSIIIIDLASGRELRRIKFDRTICKVLGVEVRRYDETGFWENLSTLAKTIDYSVSIRITTTEITKIVVIENNVYTLLKNTITTISELGNKISTEVKLYCNQSCLSSGLADYAKMFLIKDVLYITNGQKQTFVVKDGVIIYETDGGRYTSDKAVLYIKNISNKIILYTYDTCANKEITIGDFKAYDKFEEYFETYSVIMCGTDAKLYYFKDSASYERIYNSGALVEFPQEKTLAKGGRYIFLKGVRVRINDYPDNLKSISNKNRYGIVVHGYRVELIEFFSNGRYSTKTILEKSIDDTKYFNAIISESGDYMLAKYQNSSVLVNVITGEREPFECQHNITHINGYRPFFTIDSFRKPRIIDPLTLNYIDETHTSKYMFSSPDKSLCADSNQDVYIYNTISEKYISLEEYNRLKVVYNCRSNASKEEEFRIHSLQDKFIQRNSRFFTGRHINRHEFTENFIEHQGYAIIRDATDNSVREEICLGTPLMYLNYIAFSYDNKYVAITGKYPDGRGLLLVFDLNNHRQLIRKTDTYAVWTAAFSRNNTFAAYDSTPNAYIGNTGDSEVSEIKGKSFLSFSPDGNYVALSKQGYIPYSTGRPDWGHIPSSKVFISRTSDINGNVILELDDLTDGIQSTVKARTVASVSFTNDNTKFLMAGNDGVIIIRNLHLD